MSVSKLEYIWLDGYKPTQSLRSKTKIEKDFSGSLEDCPMWSFDGSSTEQAPGGSSDCLLKPVFIAKDPQRKNAYLVMCEVLNPDSTPHESNGRATIEDGDNDFWFGFEQEYFLWNPRQRVLPTRFLLIDGTALVCAQRVGEPVHLYFRQSVSHRPLDNCRGKLDLFLLGFA